MPIESGSYDDYDGDSERGVISPALRMGARVLLWATFLSMSADSPMPKHRFESDPIDPRDRAGRQVVQEKDITLDEASRQFLLPGGAMAFVRKKSETRHPWNFAADGMQPQPAVKRVYQVQFVPAPGKLFSEEDRKQAEKDLWQQLRFDEVDCNPMHTVRGDPFQNLHALKKTEITIYHDYPTEPPVVKKEAWNPQPITVETQNGVLILLPKTKKTESFAKIYTLVKVEYVLEPSRPLIQGDSGAIFRELEKYRATLAEAPGCTQANTQISSMPGGVSTVYIFFRFPHGMPKKEEKK